MKICRFKHNNEIYWGIVKDEKIFVFNNAETLPEATEINASEKSFNFDEVNFLAPVAPSKIVCVGRNYAEHAAELGNEIPKEPLLFLKSPSAIIRNNDAIKIPEQSAQVEHEGELATVIGRACRNLPDDVNPLDYVFGYLCLNDVTARDLQKKDVQFTRAKSFDTFCPVGSHIETDLDTGDIGITTKVNGIIKQSGRTSQMVFSVPFLIRYISRQMTLNAGDVIATGTPSGVSKLNQGDVCEVEIEGIGTLSNPVE